MRATVAAVAVAVTFAVGGLLAAGVPAAKDTAGAASCSMPSSVVYRRGVTCSFARRWIRRLQQGRPAPKGWHCTSGSAFRTAGYCETRMRRYFGWHPAD